MRAPGGDVAPRRPRSDPAGRPRPTRQGGGWIPYALIAPFFVAFTVFTVGPLLLAAWNSLFAKRLIGGTSFVGVDNYLRVFADADFWEGFRRIVLYGVIFTPLTICLSLLLALMIDSAATRGGGFFRMLFFVPHAVPAVVATLMWGFLYGPTISPFTDIAAKLGVAHLNLLSPGLVLFAIGNIGIWAYVGYNIIVFHAALRSIPGEVYEAAVLDGAGSWRIAWNIKIPMIKPVVTMVSIFSIIGTLQLLTEPLVLAPLAPRSIEANYTPNMYAYSLTSTGQQLNYVSALSFVLGAVVVAFSVIYLRVVNRRGDN